MQEVQIKYDNQVDLIQVKVQQINTLKQQISELQYSYNEIMVLNEKNAREITAKEELITHIQQNHAKMLNKLRNDTIELE